MNAIGSTDGAARAELHRAAVAFEGFFHGMLLRTMRKGVHENARFHGGHGETVFRSLQDNETAQRMAERGGLGIARMIEEELGRNLDAHA